MKTQVDMYLTDDYNEKGVSLPNQRVSRKVKNTEKWQKDSIDFFISNRKTTSVARKSKKEIEDNWDFYNNYLSDEALKQALDPLGVDPTLASDEGLAFKFYNILDQPFDTLFGEELKRHSETKAFALNPDIINEKDRQFKEMVLSFLKEQEQNSEQLNEEIFQEKLKYFDKYKKEDLQTAHEKMANDILQVLINDLNLNLKLTFNKGFKELELNSEEIYRVGHTGKELVFDKVNSGNFYVLGLGDSQFIEDGFAWIEVDYVNPYKLIEELAEELTDKEIDKILKMSSGAAGGIDPQKISLVDIKNPDNPLVNQALPIIHENEFIALEGSDTDEADTEGNIKIYRTQWVSLRELQYLTYYDKFGDQQHEWVDEMYVPDLLAGEEVKKVYVKEIWEGLRIGNDMYKKVRPCPVQMRNTLNPSIVRPSYVGGIMSNNGKVQQSRIDKLRPYQEMYNVWANKLVQLWTEHVGKVGVIDTAGIPSEMDSEEWLLWIKRHKLIFKNSFEEGKKGMAKGILAGNMQQNAAQLDLSLADDINQAIQTLSWIEERVNKIAAVPSPRQGDMSGREGLGTSQQAIVQSSHQTEPDFAMHELIKVRAYELMLAYIKVLWKDEKSKRQFVLSDLSNHIIDIDGELLSDVDMGVVLTNSSQLFTMYNAIQQLSHAAMQTGTATLSDVARMYLATSPSQMLHQLEFAEDKRIEQQNQQEKLRQEAMQTQMAAQKEIEQLKHQNEIEKINLEWQYKLQIEQMKLQLQHQIHSTDTNQNNIEDIVEIEAETIRTDAAKEIQAANAVSNEKIAKLQTDSKEKIEKLKIRNAPKTNSK